MNHQKMPAMQRYFVVSALLFLSWFVLGFAVYGMFKFWNAHLSGPFRDLCAWVDSVDPLISIVTVLIGIIIAIIVIVKCEEI